MLEEAELRLIASLKRNLSRHKAEEQKVGFNYSAWQAEKLRNIEKFRRENLSIMNEYTDVIDEQTRQLMNEQFEEGQRLAEQSVGQESSDNISGKHFFGVNNEKMNTLMTDITTLEKHAETAALRMADDVYRQTVNKVQIEMAVGGMSLNKALDLAVRDFLDKGINCIVYSDGKRVNIADYVRMTLRTTSTRAKLQGEAKRFAELGHDTVMVSQYGMCSKTCEPWQGRVYIDDVFTLWDGEVEERANGELWGKSKYCGKWFCLLSTAIHNGLFHPNCRHTILQYIDGVTKLPAPIPAEKIKEQRELEEKQRRMERNIRKLRRLKEGTFDPDTAKSYGRKLRAAQHELKVFTDEHNDILRRDYSREQYYGGAVDHAIKNVQIQGDFLTTNAISNDIKSEITKSIEEFQNQYDVRIDEFVLEDISVEYGKVPFQFCPVNNNGSFKSKFIINKGFNWEESLDKMNDRIYNKNYKKGVLASRNTKDLIAHEMAHFMSFQDCKGYSDFLLRERKLRQSYIAGVSGYSDALEDGSETIAEGFVRIRNGELVDDRVKSLVDEYIERWRK